jgi:hypothetical protein
LHRLLRYLHLVLRQEKGVLLTTKYL